MFSTPSVSGNRLLSEYTSAPVGHTMSACIDLHASSAAANKTADFPLPGAPAICNPR